MTAKTLCDALRFVADISETLSREAESCTRKADALGRLIDLMEEYPSLPCAEVLEAFLDEEADYE